MKNCWVSQLRCSPLQEIQTPEKLGGLGKKTFQLLTFFGSEYIQGKNDTSWRQKKNFWWNKDEQNLMPFKEKKNLVFFFVEKKGEYTKILHLKASSRELR